MKRLLALAAFAATLAAQSRTTMFPPVRGIHEMVGAANNFEVEAGYRILTQGGNAVDAGGAAYRIARGIPERGRVRRAHPRESADPRIVAGIAQLLPARRRAPQPG